jgi:hypothetical protein
MKIKLSFFLILFLFASYAFSAERHVGSDQTYKSINSAISASSSGDTIIIHNGTYTDSITSVPNGTSSSYTTIKALNAGGVIITGTLHTSYTSKYLAFEGLKWNYAGDKNIEGSYLKFKRCSFQGGGTSGYGCNVVIGTNDFPSATSYILMEDCWSYGLGGRYNFITYLADHVIFRRCIVRHDGGYGPNSGNPEAAFSIYNSQYIELQNCICLDSNLDTYVYWDQPFYIIYNSASAESTTHISVRGCISLNNKGAAYRWDGSSTTISMDAFENNIGWDMDDWFAVNGSSNIDLSISGTKATLGDKSGITDGFGDWGPGAPSLSYSIAYNCKGTLYNGWSSSNMNTSPLSAGLMYLPRTETGSALKNAGIGANVISKIGVDGTLYGETGYNTTTTNPLWPWPNEARIKIDMASVSTRGFAATGKQLNGTDNITLTSYIWEYLGNQMPSDIYSSSGGEVNTAPGSPQSVGISVTN